MSVAKQNIEISRGKNAVQGLTPTYLAWETSRDALASMQQCNSDTYGYWSLVTGHWSTVAAPAIFHQTNVFCIKQHHDELVLIRSGENSCTHILCTHKVGEEVKAAPIGICHLNTKQKDHVSLGILAKD